MNFFKEFKSKEEQTEIHIIKFDAFIFKLFIKLLIKKIWEEKNVFYNHFFVLKYNTIQ